MWFKGQSQYVMSHSFSSKPIVPVQGSKCKMYIPHTLHSVVWSFWHIPLFCTTCGGGLLHLRTYKTEQLSSTYLLLVPNWPTYPSTTCHKSFDNGDSWHEDLRLILACLSLCFCPFNKTITAKIGVDFDYWILMDWFLMYTENGEYSWICPI
jgi:hypothetical protein